MTRPQPVVSLNDGKSIPQLGFGVWEIGDDAATAVLLTAIETGFRHIDSAQAYGNERGVGRAIRECGLPREEIFVTSKLRASHYPYQKASQSLDESLERMGLAALDLFLLHWPVPGHDGLMVEAWQALIDAQKKGRIHTIGVSNFLPEHLDRLIAETGVVPAVNQLELHPYYQQRDVRAAHKALDIAIESYSPLGRGLVLEDKAITAIAKAHGKSPAQVIIRWHMQDGLIPLPKTATPLRVAENFDVFDFELSEAEMAVIAKLDKPQGKILSDPRHMNNLF